MKTFYIILKFAVAWAILTLSFACENISNPEPIDVISAEKTAIIEGTAYANLDETNDNTGTLQQDYEVAPENTTVKVVLDSRDFVSNPQAGVNYQNLTYSTTVDGSGEFTIEVPALDQPINAEIYVGDFSAMQVQADSTQETKVFSPTSFPYNVSVFADMTTFIDIVYNDN